MAESRRCRRPEVSDRVNHYLSRKRSALQAHSSQTTDVGMMLALPHDVFAAIFGTEYFIEPGREPGIRTGWIFDSEPARAATAAAARSTPTGLGPRRS